MESVKFRKDEAGEAAAGSGSAGASPSFFAGGSAISTERFLLRDLPLPARLVLALFLVAVVLGYLASLLQCHLELAAPGELLPGPATLAEIYAVPPQKPVSQVERLLTATEGELNGGGSMRPAFFEKSRRWDSLTAKLSPAEHQRLVDEREGERLALLSWVRAGAKRETYDKDDHPLGAEFASRIITEEFLVPDSSARKPAVPRRLRVRTLLERRCVDCHSGDGRHDSARNFPLDSYELLFPYCQAPKSATISVDKLALQTQVHLLETALVFGGAGLAFCFTSYARSIRLFFGPVPLVAQLAMIACWWLARLHPAFAYAVFYTAAVGGVGLAVQVGGCLWDLVPRKGSRPS